MDRRKLLTPPPLLMPSYIRVRDRNAPPARAGAGIRGWVDWALIDRTGKVARGGQSPNIWLDQGLDAIAATSMFGSQSNSANILTGISHAAVGTGSTAVDPEQTGLIAEVGRTSTTFGDATSTRTANGVYQLSKTFEFDYSVANGNLTEWGMAGASSGSLRTRALFTDEFENPITVVKTSDYKLRLAYTVEITLGPVTLTPASIEITGIGVLNGHFALVGGSATTGRLDLRFFNFLAANAIGDATNQVNCRLHTSGSWAYGTAITASSSTSASASEYVGGSYTRSLSGFWGTNAGNLTGIRQILGCASNQSAVTFLIDEADAFDKTNENTLTLTDLWTVTWARG